MPKEMILVISLAVMTAVLVKMSCTGFPNKDAAERITRLALHFSGAFCRGLLVDRQQSIPMRLRKASDRNVLTHLSSFDAERCLASRLSASCSAPSHW